MSSFTDALILKVHTDQVVTRAAHFQVAHMSGRVFGWGKRGQVALVGTTRRVAMHLHGGDHVLAERCHRPILGKRPGSGRFVSQHGSVRT